MRRFEFKLAAVLAVQERKKKVAELRRAQARQALAAAEADVVRLRTELDRTAANARDALARGGNLTLWQASSTRSRWLGTQLTAAETRVRQCRLELTRADDAYRPIAVSVEALETLRRTRWREYQDEAAAQEQRRVEEFVLRHWQPEAAGSSPAAGGKDVP